MKVFNTTGICNPQKHYMVDINDRVVAIKKMIDKGDYFTINRSRQYGKTTTLTELTKSLQSDYGVINLDFQKMSHTSFETEENFVQDFCKMIIGKTESGLVMNRETEDAIRDMASSGAPQKRLIDLFEVLRAWCRADERKLVLIIDEVDSATNNQIFLDFLAQLRDGYIAREADGIKNFQSVILAGVTDVKHLKSKIREDDQHKVNSPWNIAVDFVIDMSLSEDGICQMLDEYENDHHTGMDIRAVSKSIHDYTSGYPYLVSKICSIIDDSLGGIKWTVVGVDEAVKRLLREENVTLFDSLMGKLSNYPELKNKLYRILMMGETLEYLPYNEPQKQLRMYGFIKEDNGTVKISNRIFETLLYNHFLGEDTVGNDIKQTASYEKNMFVKDGQLDIELILERFIVAYKQVFGELEERFKEKDGREIFLLFLKPIINGTGNYYIEAQTRDQRRTDVIIDYLGNQYVIELKIWRGERYNSEGEKQILGYMDYFGLNTGYMLSFNFNKNKESGVKKIRMGNRLLVEAVL